MWQIETAIAVIIKMITETNQHTSHISSKLFSDVMCLLKQGKICEAENMLFFALDFNEETAFETAIAFYSELNKLNDDELESKNFSRDEIKSGLHEVCCINGLVYDIFL